MIITFCYNIYLIIYNPRQNMIFTAFGTVPTIHHSHIKIYPS